MTHSTIQLRSLTLALPHKICFEDVTLNIHAGSRIGIMGSNGSGKTTLLRLLQGLITPTSGSVHVPGDIRMGYVPQIVEDSKHFSGGQRFHRALSQALKSNPHVLLLDEPTNHLDARNRASLMRMLDGYEGTLIVVSHDVELLRHLDTLWHVDHGQLRVFSGSYDDYMKEMKAKRAGIEHQLGHLHRQKKDMHQSLMKEQERAKKSDQRGEKSICNRKWPTVVSNEKARRAIETSGKKKRDLRNNRQHLVETLSQLRLPEILVPTFTLPTPILGNRTLLSVRGGAAGYEGSVVLKDVYVSMGSHDRVALLGDNGSGKSTLVKAMMGDANVLKAGEWDVPFSIGYVDQHYSNLNPQQTVLEVIAQAVPDWPHGVVRQHLNSFLFRKNEEVNILVAMLSGGEKARLSLALMASNAPRLLVLDEITNNVDLMAREHIIQVLQAFPGALLVISHDEDFLAQIEVNTYIPADT